MSPTPPPLPPSSSLPPLGSLSSSSEREILGALRALSAVYCPVPAVCASLIPDPAAAAANSSSHAAPDDPVDSGYTSETEGTNEDAKRVDRRIAGLRADPFERHFAERWLSGFISRAATLPALASDDDACQAAVDQAAYVLESLVSGVLVDDELHQPEGADSDFAHEFSFDLPSDMQVTGGDKVVKVHLQDRVAGENGGDFDDVGLQLWGASVIFSELICASPSRFGLDKPSLGPSPRVIDLGAGTGLVSLVLGALLPRLGISDPRIIATDYHPVVLELLAHNVTRGALPVETALLDWSSPPAEAPFDVPANVLIATDVVYGPEHAVLLRDCAARLLAPDGVFWLFIAIRVNGKFEGITDTVETAFAADPPAGPDGKVLRILSSETIEKRKNIGRRDENGYRLFRIGWA